MNGTVESSDDVIVDMVFPFYQFRVASVNYHRMSFGSTKITMPPLSITA